MDWHNLSVCDAVYCAPEERHLLDKLKKFSRKRIATHPGLFHPQDFPSDLFCEMGEAGLLGVTNLAEIARGCTVIGSETGSLGFATAWAIQSLVPLTLSKYSGLPEEYARGATTGDLIISLAVSEPKAGAHPKYLTTTAAKVPGGWRIDGEKAYVTNGPIASHIAVLAITDQTGGRKSFSLFLVPVGADGLIRVDHPQFDFLRPAQHCGFKLDGCVVPDNALIGQPGKAYQDMAEPFRNLEDAVSAGALTAMLRRAGWRTAKALGPDMADTQAAALGELRGIEMVLEALDGLVVKSLEKWDTQSEIMDIRLTTIRDLSRRSAELLRSTGALPDEHTAIILHDVEKYLDIARIPRQIQKARLGRSYFIPGKYAE